MKKDSFDLSEFLTDSLSLQAQSPTRYTYKVKKEDPYLKLLEQDPLEIIGERFIEPQARKECVTGSHIQEFYRGHRIFITGGTGFVGKILIDKFIRSVPNIGHIYLLIRGKKGKSSTERFEELMADQVFLRMRTEVPDYTKKISVLEGDITLPGLGLSDTDRQMLIDNVNIIFNSAADVRFIEPLRSSLTSNVLGSRNVLTLAKEVKDLKCFLHVSTAYSQCVRRKVLEEVPKLPVYSYNEVIELIQSKSDLELGTEREKIMQGWPNTYTFTKAMCEEMLVEEGKDLPLCIFRPAIVGNSYKEPVRGWTDNLYGPIGMFVGAGFGVLHCFPLTFDLHVEVVPVDYVVNFIIAAAWRTYEIRKTTTLTVYNFTASPEKLHTWKKSTDIALKYRDAYPYYHALYYPSFVRTSSKIVDRIIHVVFHQVPGIIIDSLCLLVGLQPRLSKVYDRVSRLKEPLEWFSDRVWQFEKENVYTLSQSMSEEDKKLFNFDVLDFDLTVYMIQSLIGVRYFYLKESMETLPVARLKNQCLRWVHFSLKAFCYFAALKLLSLTAHYVPF